VKGTVSPTARVGRKTVLHPDVEKELARVCVYLYEANLSIHRSLIQHIARDIAVATGVDPENFDASDHWFAGFKARHPELATRKACKINRARSVSFNRFAVESWYTAMREILALYKPEEIWNCDDTSKDPELFSGLVRYQTCSILWQALCAG
jgi:hypothetical protein